MFRVVGRFKLIWAQLEPIWVSGIKTISLSPAYCGHCGPDMQASISYPTMVLSQIKLKDIKNMHRFPLAFSRGPKLSKAGPKDPIQSKEVCL